MRPARPGSGSSPSTPDYAWPAITPLPPAPAPPALPDGEAPRGLPLAAGGTAGGASTPAPSQATAVVLGAAQPATAGGGSAARPVLPPVLVAVVGGGRMGNIRLAALAANPRTELSVFVDADEAVAEATGARYGIPWRQSLGDALADFPDTVAVWVATPTPTHTNLIAYAASVGLHVAVEKPVADSLGGVAAAYAATRAARVHLYCAFQRRFDPGYCAVASAVTDGTLGAVSSAVGVFRDHPPPPASFFESGGGDLYLDLSVHDVDFLCHTLGEVPVGVVATESESGLRQPLRQSPAPPADGMVDAMPTSSMPGAQESSGGGAGGGAAAAVDLPAAAAAAAGDMSPGGRPASAEVGGQAVATGVLTLWYPSGVVATLLLSRVSATGYDQRLEVHGSLGSARVDNPTTHGTVVSSAGGSLGAPAPHSFPQRFREAFAAEVEHFADLVLGEAASPIVSEADTAVSLAVALAGGMSAADGGRPVRLAEVWGDVPLHGTHGGKRRRGGIAPAARVPVFNADGQPRRRPGRPKGSRNRKTLEREEAAAAAMVAAAAAAAGMASPQSREARAGGASGDPSVAGGGGRGPAGLEERGVRGSSLGNLPSAGATLSGRGAAPRSGGGASGRGGGRGATGRVAGALGHPLVPPDGDPDARLQEAMELADEAVAEALSGLSDVRPARP